MTCMPITFAPILDHFSFVRGMFTIRSNRYAGLWHSNIASPTWREWVLDALNHPSPPVSDMARRISAEVDPESCREQR